MTASRAVFRRIFVPVDASAAAMAALRLAARVAKGGQGRIRLCYVVDDSPTRGTTGSLLVRRRFREELETEGRAVLRRAAAVCRHAGVACTEVVVYGPIVDELVKAARRHRADVMVVSTRGRGALRALLRGSLIPALVSRTPCPLLVVRHRRR